MIGLLKKDFYILWHAYKKNLTLVAVLYTGIALLMDMNFMLFMMCWVMGFYVIGSLSIDNASKWDLYAASLPVSRAQLVGAKFLMVLLALGAGTIYGMLVGVVQQLVNGTPLAETLISSLIVALVCVLYFGVTLTLAYQFGVEKARTAMLLLIAGFGAVVVLGVRAGWLDGDFPDTVAAPTLLLSMEAHPALWLAGAMAVCAAVYLTCWGISVAIYRKKEF